MNKRALELIAKEKIEKTGKLNLAKLDLKVIPDLSEMNWLMELDISDNKINKLENLPDQLKSLYISYNQINKLENLPDQLNELYIRNNKINKLENLPDQLNSLSIRNNQINKLENLPDQLNKLDISYNKINKLENLPDQLNELYISYNKINKLENLPDQLNELYISYNKINKLENLPDQLKSLSISNNQINKLENLPDQLKSLSISYNQINKLENLPDQLNELYISYNKINKLENLPDQLKSLDIRNNKINNIPLLVLKKFKTFTLEKYDRSGLSLYGNPITSPPLEILEQGRQSVLDWFQANKKQLKEIKVILIGDPKAGKTSLLRQLKEGTFNEAEVQTDGINIESIKFGATKTFQKQTSLHDLTGHFWDFGGQEIMNATHQFFLTSRSVYVLVLDARKDNHVGNQIRQWVKNIISTGGNSPIIIVSNKIDINPGFGFENEYELQQEFPQIKYFLTASSKTKENIELVKEKLAELIPKAEFFNTEIDERWINIKEQLQTETGKTHFLNEKRFLEICQTHQLTQPNEQRNAIRFLHDLGLVLHFEELNLAEYFVLDSYWITYGVYQIVTSKYAGEQKGKVSMGKLKYIINEEEDKEGVYQADNSQKIIYSNNERRFLVDILNQFKLSFYETDRKHFILPDLLDTHEPTDLTVPIRESKDSIRFVYEYEYLPKSIIPYIMVEAHKIMHAAWRTGCIICSNGNQALISVYQNRLSIIVEGTHKSKREFMSVERYLIDGIHRELRIQPKMLIPLPDVPNEFANYETLLKMERKGRKEYEIFEPIEKEYEISKLLEGISNLKQSEFENRKIQEKLDKILDNQKVFPEMNAKLDRIESALNNLAPLDLNTMNKILEVKLNALANEMPDKIAQQWKELKEDKSFETDSKLKVKAKMDLFFLSIEKEFAVEAPLTFQNIKKTGNQLVEWLEGKRSFKNLWVEEKKLLE